MEAMLAAGEPARWILIGLGLLAGSVAFWLLMVGSIAWLGGWRRLSRDHRALREPSGPAFSWCNLTLGRGTHYRGCVRVVLTPNCLYLRPFWIMRFGHPPLFLPWEKAGPRECRRQWGREIHTLPLSASGKKVRIELPAAAWAWMERHLKDRAKRRILGS